MLNNVDWHFLSRALIILVIAIVLSAALLVFGWQYEQSKFKAYSTGKNQLQATHSKYERLVSELDLMKVFTERYSDYKNNGLIGPERRLSWIETLESVNEVMKLPKLTYELLPQEKFDRPRLSVDRNVEVNSTPMKLRVDLMHEEDILALFEGIEGGIDNLFTIDQCSLQRNGKVVSPVSTKGVNLSSVCLMRWITVNVKE
jgi:hypothetical protein